MSFSDGLDLLPSASPSIRSLLSTLCVAEYDDSPWQSPQSPGSKRKAGLVAEIAAVPDAPDRLEAQARLKSQGDKGAMACVQAPPCTDPGRTMQSDLFREALWALAGLILVADAGLQPAQRS